jgi:hypothetical protein
MFEFYFSDGKYNAEVLEHCLKEAFGLVKSRPSGMKFAVTATIISDATLYLFSNYNS